MMIAGRSFVRYGKWWAIQFDGNRPFALGVHVEHRSFDSLACASGDPALDARGLPRKFGPHIDLHLPFLIVSVGRHPVYTTRAEIGKTYARGGISV